MLEPCSKDPCRQSEKAGGSLTLILPPWGILLALTNEMLIVANSPAIAMEVLKSIANDERAPIVVRSLLTGGN